MSNVSFYFCPRGLPRTNTITDKLVMYCTALGSEVRQIPIIFNLICIRFLLMDWMAPIDRPRSELNLAINNQPLPSSPRPTSGLDIKMKQNLDLHLTSDIRHVDSPIYDVHWPPCLLSVVSLCEVGCGPRPPYTRTSGSGHSRLGPPADNTLCRAPEHRRNSIKSENVENFHSDKKQAILYD